MRAAKVIGGIVTNLWEVPSLDCFEGLTLIAAPADCGEGYSYSGGVFTPPAEVPALTTTPLQFIELFTEAEQLAVVTAAMAVPALRLWYDKLVAAQEVVLADPRLSSGMNALVSAGLITYARRFEILAVDNSPIPLTEP
jgi:hypothetical protein